MRRLTEIELERIGRVLTFNGIDEQVITHLLNLERRRKYVGVVRQVDGWTLAATREPQSLMKYVAYSCMYKLADRLVEDYPGTYGVDVDADGTVKIKFGLEFLEETRPNLRPLAGRLEEAVKDSASVTRPLRLMPWSDKK